MGYNASQTKSPVCYDLRKTQWQAQHGEFVFSFSTCAHRDKFLRECDKRIDWLNDSMSRRFHVPCDFEPLALVQLYQQIEGRGFLVWNHVTGELFEYAADFLCTVSAVKYDG